MKLTYENIVRVVLFLLLVLGIFFPDKLNPSFVLIVFSVYEFMVRKFEKPEPIRDVSPELKILEEKVAALEKTAGELKNDISIGKIAQTFTKR